MLSFEMGVEFCLIMKKCSDIDTDTYSVEFLKGRAAFGLGRRKVPLLSDFFRVVVTFG